MGWTSYYRPAGESDRDHFSRELFRDSDHEIVECATVGSVFYAAVRTKSTGEVWALIVLMQRNPGGDYNFAYKDMSETMGPVEASAPAKVLNALTPTTNEYALEWRAQCRERLTRRAEVRQRAKLVVAGTTIRVNQPLHFHNGLEASRFQCLNSTGRSFGWLAITEDGTQFPCRLGADWAHELRWEIEPTQDSS